MQRITKFTRLQTDKPKDVNAQKQHKLLETGDEENLESSQKDSRTSYTKNK